MHITRAAFFVFLLSCSSTEASQCKIFYEGLCPGPSSCMCTLNESCPTLHHQPNVSRAISQSGRCAGDCRHVEENQCDGPWNCLFDAGPCGQPIPVPSAPPTPSVTPSPGVRPSLIGMVAIPSVPGSFIDIFESCVEFQDETGKWVLNAFNENIDGFDTRGVSYRAVSPVAFLPKTVKPQAYISQHQSAVACACAGKHLCTLEEWLSSCSVNNAPFPYGETYYHGYCNEGHENPILIVYGPNATWNLTEMNNPILDTLPNTLVIGGQFLNCTNNVTRTFDMSGNLDEWVSDITPEGHGIFKGGYFVDAFINGPGCHYETVAHAPIYHDYSLGFRCCVTSEMSP